MRILVTNDDGLSEGLRALIEEGRRRGHELFVATTGSQGSGKGKSISFRVEYRFTDIFGVKGIVVDSNPADAVAVVLDGISREFDAVVSGVNQGPNLGLWDVLSSGTVGAVLEAVTRGLVGLSVSLVARRWSDYQTIPLDRYFVAARVAFDVLEKLSGVEWRDPVININVPAWEAKGLRVTFLEKTPVEYIFHCRDRVCEAGKWHLGLYRCAHAESDVCAVLDGYVSVTPLSPFGCEDKTWLERVLL